MADHDHYDSSLRTVLSSSAVVREQSHINWGVAGNWDTLKNRIDTFVVCADEKEATIAIKNGRTELAGGAPQSENSWQSFFSQFSAQNRNLFLCELVEDGAPSRTQHNWLLLWFFVCSTLAMAREFFRVQHLPYSTSFAKPEQPSAIIPTWNAWDFFSA